VIDGEVMESIRVEVKCGERERGGEGGGCAECAFGTGGIVLKHLGEEEGEGERDRLFRREVAASLCLPPHAHVLRARGYRLSEAGGLDLLLPRAEMDMLSLLLSPSPPPVRTILLLSLPLCDALAFLHSYNWIHRDVKWDNVLLYAEREGEGGEYVSLEEPAQQVKPVLADLGLARHLDDDDCAIPSEARGEAAGGRRMSICGTESHQAPEMALGAEYGPPADVFSLSLCLFQAIAGMDSLASRSPYDVDLPWDRLSDSLAGTPLAGDAADRLLAALRAGTAASPDDRPTAGDLASTLRSCL
jgi:serine/threonine protein kinase